MFGGYDKDNLDRLLAGEGDWFTAQLVRLIAKADTLNRGKLRKGFPEEVEAVEQYLGRVPTGASRGGPHEQR